jgi:hypothetical protein
MSWTRLNYHFASRFYGRCYAWSRQIEQRLLDCYNMSGWGSDGYIWAKS